MVNQKSFTTSSSADDVIVNLEGIITNLNVHRVNFRVTGSSTPPALKEVTIMGWFRGGILRGIQYAREYSAQRSPEVAEACVSDKSGLWQAYNYINNLTERDQEDAMRIKSYRDTAHRGTDHGDIALFNIWERKAAAPVDLCVESLLYITKRTINR
jgi:hypothetical protein